DRAIVGHGVQRDGVDEVVGGGKAGVETGIGGGNGQPRRAVKDGQVARGAVGVEDHGRGKRVVAPGQAVAEEDAAGTVEDDAIDPTVAVEAGQVGRVEQPDRAGKRDGKVERPVAVAQQHAARFADVGGDDVGFAVAVDVRHGHRLRTSADGKGLPGLEG